ncbi:hypothetical protein SD70_26000 [Gordoniibacillus kamchatkensis]|uniref:Uncharacterized protein n=1 Tax=Gordoniibacillus kamchatkensis TaxID=1590651 RepID=A0ABR5ABT4_9BACL|nr:hypothetical protein SD70_26000 [Paenibacillus sp. VKM B-2647]
MDNNLICEVDALRFWNAIPKEKRDHILNNVFCGNCLDVVRIVDCSIYNDANGLLLRGKCNKCGNSVAQVIERE